MNNADFVLEIIGVTKRFNNVLALDQVSLSLKRGEWLGLIGSNGSGKTSLIRAICGRLRLDQGIIRLQGKDIISCSTALHSQYLGVVPQSIALFPLLTIAENFQVFGALYGLRESHLLSAVEWALDWTGLGSERDKMAIHLSGGMARRANIACGVIHRPSVLLLDEPMVGVDAKSHQHIVEMLEGLRSEGTSFLFTTHQIEEAEKNCDRIAIIDHGKLVACGTRDELIEQAIGKDCRLQITLNEAPKSIRGFDQLEIQGNKLAWYVADIDTDLPSILSQIHAMGCQIKDISIERPSLEAALLRFIDRESAS